METVESPPMGINNVMQDRVLVELNGIEPSAS